MFTSMRCFLFLALVPFTAASAPQDAIRVHVEPHKSVVILGEPVLVTATVVNAGSEPVKLIHHHAPTLLRSELSVVALRFGADEEHFKEWSDRLRPLVETGPRTLAPGESVTVDLVMLFNSRDGFFATEPGRYRVQGRIYVHDIGEILSPPVEIEVREPTPADRPTWEWLNTNKEEYGRMVQIPWEAKLSNEFVRGCGRRCESSQSTYAVFLARFLSQSYKYGPKKNFKEARRFAEIAKARASSDKTRGEPEKAIEPSRGDAKQP
jgi:hypothetical protein